MMMEIFKEQCLILFGRYKHFCYAAGFVICGIFVLIISMGKTPGPEEYVAAKKAFLRWDSAGDSESYVEMRKTLKSVPTLEGKYRSFIAQKLFREDHLSDALILASQALEQIQGEAPFHFDYGNATLSIEKGSYQEALEKAVGLKEKMLRERFLTQDDGELPAGGCFLFAHNLLRIASLQRELHNKPGEKSAWEEFEKFLSAHESVERLIMANFKDKEITLSDYIAERKKSL
jgi:hypothetical protein